MNAIVKTMNLGKIKNKTQREKGNFPLDNGALLLARCVLANCVFFFVGKKCLCEYFCVCCSPRSINTNARNVCVRDRATETIRADTGSFFAFVVVGLGVRVCVCVRALLLLWIVCMRTH